MINLKASKSLDKNQILDLNMQVKIGEMQGLFLSATLC